MNIASVVSAPNQPKKEQAKKEQILQGALEVFLRRGYEGTSMDRIAAAAGVSKITIYKHFQDKEGLFTALITRVTAEKFQKVFGTLPLEESPAIALRQIATKLLDMLAVDEDYVAFLRLIIGESGRFPALAQLFVEALPKRAWCVLSEYFEAHPELDQPNSEATARIFTGTLISYVLTQKLLHGQAVAPMDSEVMVDNLIELIVR